MTDQPALHESGPTRTFPLSGYFGHHAGPGAKYKSSTSRQPCDECIRLQHDSRGAFGTRGRVRWERTGHGGRLLLCEAHKQEWTELDEAA